MSSERNSLPPGEAAFNQLLSAYKRNASTRRIEWHLTKDEFRMLTQQDCYYCGAEPEQCASFGRSDLNGDYVYNGVDRVDNAAYYLWDNCVSCCGRCNKAKDSMTVDEFLDWVDTVHRHQRGNR